MFDLPVKVKSITLLIILLLVVSTNAGTGLLSYQGRLTDSNDNPVEDGSHEVRFSIFGDLTGGEELWFETAEIATSSGYFVHLLGSVTPLPSDLFAGPDERYLQVTVAGEVLSPRTLLTATPFAFSSGGLRVVDESAVPAIVTDANNHSLTIYDAQGDPKVLLQGLEGDSAVMLPDSAINSEELLDEPGLAVNTNVHAVPLITSIMSDLVEVDITTPADGYILLVGKCYLLLSGTTGPNNALVQIDETEGGGTQFPYYAQAGLSGYVNTGTNYFPIFVQRAYYKPAGTYTFRLEARASYPLPARAECWDNILTAIYYPTEYEAINVIAPTTLGAPGAVMARRTASRDPK